MSKKRIVVRTKMLEVEMSSINYFLNRGFVEVK